MPRGRRRRRDPPPIPTEGQRQGRGHGSAMRHEGADARSWCGSRRPWRAARSKEPRAAARILGDHGDGRTRHEGADEGPRRIAGGCGEGRGVEPGAAGEGVDPREHVNGRARHEGR